LCHSKNKKIQDNSSLNNNLNQIVNSDGVIRK